MFKINCEKGCQTPELGVFALQEFKERHKPPKPFKADLRLRQLKVVRLLFFNYFNASVILVDFKMNIL